jgi:hypothetical protein
MSGGGTTSTQTTSMPTWLEDTAKEQLEKVTALTNIEDNPYQQYTGQRIAGFNPMQQQVFQGVQNLGTSGAVGQGIDIAGQAANRALGANYQPGQFDADRVQAQGLQNYQMQAPANVNAQGYNAATMQAAQTGYNPQLQTFQMGPAERVNTQSFAQPGSAEAYMNPYMQNVVDIQKREAARQSGIQGTQQQAQAAQAGAFGGGRDAILRAERERNLGQQMNDIQERGSQSAYQQAQQQFNAEQAARLQAQQANQQAGLTVGQQNLASQIGTQQLGAQTGLQTALANLSNQQQAAVQNQAAQNQAMGMNAQQALQAALANQSAGLNTNQQNLAANLGVQQLGAQQGLQAALANQQYGLSAQQLAEQSRQYGAGLGIQGLQTALSGASQLGGLGSTQFGQQKDILNAQQTVGSQQQAQDQAQLTQDYNDFLNRQKYPYQQLEFMQNIVRGTPYGSTTSMYTPPPSTISQLAGLGTAAYGLSSLKPFAEGGSVEDDQAANKMGGLPALALYKVVRG